MQTGNPWNCTGRSGIGGKLYELSWTIDTDTLHYVQCDVKLWYIEIIKVFEIFRIVADIKLIHATYCFFAVAAKSESRKIWLPANKKGESTGWDTPFWVWISPRYPKWILREFRSNYCGISWPPCPLKKRISQIFGSFEKLWLVGGISSFTTLKRLVLYSRYYWFRKSGGTIRKS